MSIAAKNHSITDLELYGLAVNIACFSHLLKRDDFHAVVNHLDFTHIMNSKSEPATNRITRLLQVLCSYLFKLFSL